MAYNFSKKPTSTFKFYTDTANSPKMSLNGINATLTSADTICDGVSSLMAIGGNEPAFYDAIRTSQETVEET